MRETQEQRSEGQRGEGQSGARVKRGLRPYRGGGKSYDQRDKGQRADGLTGRGAKVVWEQRGKCLMDWRPEGQGSMRVGVREARF